MNTSPQTRLPFSDLKNEDIRELRLCVAKLRSALSDSIGWEPKPIDAAHLLNETTDTAIRYKCYESQI